MHSNVLRPCLRCWHILFLMVLMLSQVALPAHAKKSDTLRFQLTISDFYDPLLPPGQSQIRLDELTSEQITIMGGYEPIRDHSKTVIQRVYERDCMVGVMCFGGKWVTNKTFDDIKAVSISYNPQQRQISFELPAPLSTPSLAYKLIDISVVTPFVSLSFSYQAKNTSVSYVKADIQSDLYLKNPDPDDRYLHVALVSSKGVIAHLSTSKSAQRQTQGQMVFSEQERKDLFRDRKLLDYGGLFPISIPKTLPSWYQMNYSTHPSYQTEGILVNDKQIEAVILKGSVAYTQSEKTENYYSKDEYWLRYAGQLTHIYRDPIHIPAYGCNFTYGVTFFEDGTEERYIAKDISSQEKFEEKQIEKKKTYVTLNDLSALDIYNDDREKYYTDQEKRHPTIENGLPACKRMVADAKRLLGTPKAQLEQEFEQYKKIIEDADKERRKGY